MRYAPLGPDLKRALSAMAHDDEIGPNLPCEVPNLFGGLTSHQLCDGIETKLPQSRNALVKHIHKVIFHLN